MRLAIALAALAACGSPEASLAVVADYVGAFEYEAGSSSALDCQDNSLDGVSAMTGPLELELGETSELVEVPQPGAPCTGLRFDLVGGVATAQPGQVCRRSTDGITFESMFTTYRLALEDDTLTIDGFIDVDVSGVISTTCTSTVHAVAARRAP